MNTMPKTRARFSRSGHGFTLIELMIVTVIIAVLAAIAYPSYTEHVARSRRANAKAALMEVGQWMEREFTVSGRYDQLADATPITDAMLTPARIPSLSALNGFYTLSFDGGITRSTYRVQAVPVSGGTMASDRCGTFVTNQAGQKLLGDSSPSEDLLRDCWNR
jgi:type IV pilus assembly protein PilE